MPFTLFGTVGDPLLGLPPVTGVFTGTFTTGAFGITTTPAGSDSHIASAGFNPNTGFGVPLTIPAFVTPLTTTGVTNSIPETSPIGGLDTSFIFPTVLSTDFFMTVTPVVPTPPGLSLTGTDGNDTMSGSPNNDIIDGRARNDVILGAPGNDTLFGGLGDDLLHGGLGDDVLLGGFDNDTLWGDGGDDTLIGGIGMDIFAFATGSGHDRIDDFDPGSGDRISLAPGMPFAFGINGAGDAVIVFSATDDVTLTGIRLSQLTPDLFLTH